MMNLLYCDVVICFRKFRETKSSIMAVRFIMPAIEQTPDEEETIMPKVETNSAEETPFVEKPTWMPVNEINGSSERPIRVRQALFILKSTNFHKRQSPIKTLQEKFRICGLDLTVFGEDPILFCIFKQRLFGKFRGNLLIYKPLICLINQKNWSWQVNMIWETLFNKPRHEDSYAILETLINSP